MAFEVLRNAARGHYTAGLGGQPKKRFESAGNGASPALARTPMFRASRSVPMPFAVALLCHPLGAFAALVAAIAATLFAAQSHRFLPAFTAASAALLTLLAFAQVPPSALGLTWLFIGIVLLHAEFLWPTYGLAGLLGLAVTAWGSWSLLGPLSPLIRGCVAVLGAVLLLAAVARTMR
jgi:hypothetical protein